MSFYVFSFLQVHIVSKYCFFISNSLLFSHRMFQFITVTMYRNVQHYILPHRTVPHRTVLYEDQFGKRKKKKKMYFKKFRQSDNHVVRTKNWEALVKKNVEVLIFNTPKPYCHHSELETLFAGRFIKLKIFYADWPYLIRNNLSFLFLGLVLKYLTPPPPGLSFFPGPPIRAPTHPTRPYGLDDCKLFMFHNFVVKISEIWTRGSW